MSAMKRWFEEHISEFTDEQLLEMAYSQESIDLMRECFTSEESEES